MDVIATYLYIFIDNDIYIYIYIYIYMKFPEGFKFLEANNKKSHSMFSIKFQRSLYGLKQSRRL